MISARNPSVYSEIFHSRSSYQARTPALEVKCSRNVREHVRRADAAEEHPYAVAPCRLVRSVLELEPKPKQVLRIDSRLTLRYCYHEGARGYQKSLRIRGCERVYPHERVPTCTVVDAIDIRKLFASYECRSFVRRQGDETDPRPYPAVGRIGTDRSSPILIMYVRLACFYR